MLLLCHTSHSAGVIQHIPEDVCVKVEPERFSEETLCSTHVAMTVPHTFVELPLFYYLQSGYCLFLLRAVLHANSYFVS